MVRFKPEVRIAYFHPRLAEILEYASVWSLRAGIDVEVNSINDSQHGATTLHVYDLAVDLDTAGDKPADLSKLYAWMARYLPAGYDVLNEGDHVHVEIDAGRKAVTAPPVG